MYQTHTRDHRSRQVAARGFLLGILVLMVLALALLALTIPDVMVELPVTPTFTDYPVTAHPGF